MQEFNDPHLKTIAEYLRAKCQCHTAILYGSRARGSVTSTSDYDVVGIRKNGTQYRVAKKIKGVYWDLFVCSEKDLKKLGELQLGWRDAKVLFERNGFGQKLVRRIEKHVNKPYKPLQKSEIDVLKVWSEKQLERCQEKSIHGLYRRAELHTAAIEHYFVVRRKRFWGPKAGLLWLEANDTVTFKLYQRVLSSPDNFRLLERLIKRVYSRQRNSRADEIDRDRRRSNSAI